MLNELGIKYHTDKSTLLHGYLDHYEQVFEKPEEVKNIVEIGLQRGGSWNKKDKQLPSVKMWLEFFPSADLYGFDIKNLESDNPRVNLFKGNQKIFKDLIKFSKSIPNGVDFIIDDGSHDPYDQLNTFNILFHRLKKDGIYIIEDCNAVVQQEYKFEERIAQLIVPEIKNLKHQWINSNSAGVKSSLIIWKK